MKALPESQITLRSLVQSASDIITIMDPNGTIVYQSPAIERLLGYRVEELIGAYAFEYIHPEDVERVLGIFIQTLESGGVSPLVEFRFRHADGSWRHLEAIGNSLLENANVGGMVVNSRDITERKRAEEEIRRLNEALESRVEERTVQLKAALDEIKLLNEQLEQRVEQRTAQLRAINEELESFS